MVDLLTIDKAEVERILTLEESHFLNFKSALTPPAKLSEAISSFWNSAGGELFVGIDELPESPFEN